jgi:hypothetical protein
VRLRFYGPQVENLRNGRQECLRYAGAMLALSSEFQPEEKPLKRLKIFVWRFSPS